MDRPLLLLAILSHFCWYKKRGSRQRHVAVAAISRDRPRELPVRPHGLSYVRNGPGFGFEEEIGAYSAPVECLGRAHRKKPWRLSRVPLITSIGAFFIGAASAATGLALGTKAVNSNVAF